MTYTFSIFVRASRALRGVVAITALALLPIAAAVAVEGRHSPLPDASAPFGPMGWGLVVTLGLLAVAAGAFTMGRPNRPKPLDRAANDSTLGTTIVESAPAEARILPESEVGSESAPHTQGPDSTPATFPEPHAFLALHHVDLSIDVLRRHIDGEARPMPAVWVMLLDLCRTHGR